MAKWKAGGEHPLARHPLAVRCDGYSGCFTVAPIRILPDYSKRYCFNHLPTKPEGESSNTPDPTLEFLKANNLPLTRENYLYVEYMGNPPKELDAEGEAALPAEVTKNQKE